MHTDMFLRSDLFMTIPNVWRATQARFKLPVCATDTDAGTQVSWRNL